MNSPDAETPASLLARIRRRYLHSREFNGLHAQGPAIHAVREAAIKLVQDGLVQVVSERDYLNPHIRPWPSRRSIEDQTQELHDLDPGDYGVCLYPTTSGMKGVPLPRRLSDRPFQKAMAKGRGTLELAYFSVDVLEQYRNDSRYNFRFGDSGAQMGVANEVYLDATEPKRDKVSLGHIGFAYDLRRFDPDDLDSLIVRRAAVFFCDLARLSPEHQQRWKTYQVPDDGLSPHPLWWGAQMGNWPDGVGPFERLFIELKSINELTEQGLGDKMFASTDRPGEMGWLLRPSQREWDDFVSQLDKVLSENLRHPFFDGMGTPSRDSGGQMMGSLNRLGHFMEANGVPPAKAPLALSPLREVRRARQRPAHSLRTNITDKTFVHRQIALLHEVNQSLAGIRGWLASHPRNHEWKSHHADLKDYIF